MALVWFKTVVAVAGTPGPLLGDGTKTTCTILAPAAAGQGNELKVADDSLGKYVSVLNSATRLDFSVGMLQLLAMKSNTNPIFFGPKGVTSASMVQVEKTAPGNVVPVVSPGTDDRAVNLGDIDIDVTTSGEGFLWVANIL
jgi:hypothetical protein